MECTSVSRLSTKWNDRNLLAPATCRIAYTSGDIDAGVLQHVRSLLDKMADYLASPAAVPALNSELFIISKLIYKAHNSFRRQAVFTSLKQICRCLKRFHEVNLPLCIRNLQDSWPSLGEVHEGFNRVYVASQPMVDHLLVRLLGVSLLLHQLVIYTNIGFQQIMDEIHQGMLIPQMLVFLAATCRIWALCHSLKKHVISWYGSLYVDRQKLKPGLVDWLNGEIPHNLEEWLGPEPGKQIFEQLAESRLNEEVDLGSQGMDVTEEDLGQLITREADDINSSVSASTLTTPGRHHLSLDADLSAFVDELGLSVDRNNYDLERASGMELPEKLSVCVDINSNDLQTSMSTPDTERGETHSPPGQAAKRLKIKWLHQMETCEDFDSLIKLYECMNCCLKKESMKVTHGKCQRFLRKRARLYEADGRQAHLSRAKKYLIQAFESVSFNKRLHDKPVMPLSVSETVFAAGSSISGELSVSQNASVELRTTSEMHIASDAGSGTSAPELNVLNAEWCKLLDGCQSHDSVVDIFENMKKCLKKHTRQYLEPSTALSKQLSRYQTNGRKIHMKKAKTILRQQFESAPYTKKLHITKQKEPNTRNTDKTLPHTGSPQQITSVGVGQPQDRTRIGRLLSTSLKGKKHVKAMISELESSRTLRLSSWQYELGRASAKKCARMLKKLHMLMLKKQDRPEEMEVMKELVQETLLNRLCDVLPNEQKFKKNAMPVDNMEQTEQWEVKGKHMDSSPVNNKTKKKKGNSIISQAHRVDVDELEGQKNAKIHDFRVLTASSTTSVVEDAVKMRNPRMSENGLNKRNVKLNETPTEGFGSADSAKKNKSRRKKAKLDDSLSDGVESNTLQKKRVSKKNKVKIVPRSDGITEEIAVRKNRVLKKEEVDMSDSPRISLQKSQSGKETVKINDSRGTSVKKKSKGKKKMKVHGSQGMLKQKCVSKKKKMKNNDSRSNRVGRVKSGKKYKSKRGKS